MRDLHHGLNAVQALDPAVTNATRAGAPIDRQGFESVDHLVAIGTSGDTLSATDAIECRLEHSEDGSSWLPVSKPAQVLGADVDEDGMFALIDDVSLEGAVYRIGYAGGARYSRVNVIFTGTHANGTPLGAFALLGHALNAPAA